MARKKSLRDIHNQADRIKAALSLRSVAHPNSQQDWDRYIRVRNTEARYANNIAKSRQYKKDVGLGSLSTDNYVSRLSNARNRQYSRNTYMGLNQG